MIFSPEYDNSCNRSRRVQNLIKSSLPNAKHLSILFWSRLENQNIVLICVHWPQLLGDLIIILLLVLFSQSSDHCLSQGASMVLRATAAPRRRMSSRELIGRSSAQHASSCGRWQQLGTDGELAELASGASAKVNRRPPVQ